MGVQIILTIDSVELYADLNDSPVAAALAANLPAETSMNRWGDEYYGPIGLGMTNDDSARDEVEVGTLAYWPAGDSLCIFFGPTPVSIGNEPRAASAVTIVGVVAEGSESLRQLGSSVRVSIRRR